jgi:glycosyltransferase involved in cell wall biosynthesis
MQRKKILWLTSWYPNKNDRFDGDFIQRHARAAAIYHDVHVIFVTDVEMVESIDEEWNYATGLTEQIIYFKKRSGFAARVRKQIIWKNTFQQAIRNYIQKNGLPVCVHVHIPWKAGLIALWMKKKYGIDFIVAEQWGIYNTETTHNFYTKPKLVQKLLKKVFFKAKVFESVSYDLSFNVEKAVGRKANVVIPNVVDATLFFPAEHKYSKFTFIHVSNGAYWKNIDLILSAFVKLKSKKPQAQFVLIGNRDNRYVEMARGLGLLNNSVFFRNEISYKEVAEEMRRAHCHVLFGNYETFSCVTAEALCSGLPILVPGAGAVIELATTSNGYIVPKDDVEALVEAMIKMIDNYDQFNPKIISEEATKKFSYSAIAEKFNDLYQIYC